MELYVVKSDVFKTNYNHWRVLLKKEDDLYGIVDSLGKGEEPEMEKPLKMMLINDSSQTPEFLKEGNPFDLDLFRWSDDLLYEAFTPLVGGGSYFILSNRLLNILKKYRIPDYFVKKILLINTSNQDMKEYNLLFIKEGFYQNMDYRKTTFTVSTSYPRKIVKMIKDGSITSREELTLRQQEIFKEKKLLLMFGEIVLEGDYDVLWGLPNVLYINHEVKIEIEKANIKGIGIYPLKDLNFVMKSEYQNRLNK